MEKTKDTAFVRNELSKASSVSEGLKILEQNSDVIADKTFSEYFTEFLALHPDYIPSKIIEASGISRQYAHEVIKGIKKASRDRIIALCFAAHMNEDEMNHALIYAGYSPLYARDKRDSCLLLAVNLMHNSSRDFKSVFDLNDFLDDQGHRPLEISRDF